MMLTLPFTAPSRVSDAPAAIILAIGGRRFDFFSVTEAKHIEAPILDVGHCTTCGCKASSEIRSCIKPACPARERRAA